MKKLILNLILPLSIISFLTISKWWYLIPIDGTNSMFYGFPLPYYGDSWHTSGALQFFAFEMIVDFITYFLIWFIVIFCFNKFIKPIKFLRVPIFIIWGVAILFSFIFVYIASLPDNRFQLKRDFEIHKVIDSGIYVLFKERPTKNKNE